MIEINSVEYHLGKTLELAGAMGTKESITYFKSR
jgi:hypothetical protein